MRTTISTTAAVAAAGLAIVIAPAAAADTPDPAGWTVTDTARPAQSWTVADHRAASLPQDARQAPDVARRNTGAVRRSTGRSTGRSTARPAYRVRRIRVAGQARYPWRPTTTCRPLARTATGRLVWTVRPGDTLWHIADCTGATVAQLRAANPTAATGLILPGQPIAIPEANR